MIFFLYGTEGVQLIGMGSNKPNADEIPSQYNNIYFALAKLKNETEEKNNACMEVEINYFYSIFALSKLKMSNGTDE